MAVNVFILGGELRWIFCLLWLFVFKIGIRLVVGLFFMLAKVLINSGLVSTVVLFMVLSLPGVRDLRAMALL